VLSAMIRAGKADITVGCRGGGCGSCKVEILSGRYMTLRMSRERVSEEEEMRGIVLACRTMPLSDMILRVLRVPPWRELTAPTSESS